RQPLADRTLFNLFERLRLDSQSAPEAYGRRWSLLSLRAVPRQQTKRGNVMKANVNSEAKRGMGCCSDGNRHLTVWSTLVTLMIHLALSSVMVSQAHAVGGSLTVLNGSDPRPFYIMAHNPNTPEEVDAALQVGGVDADPLANAMEPDITLATGCPGGDILVDWDSTSPNRHG